MKKKLRREYIDKRNSIADREDLSARICERVSSLREYKNAKNILCYASFGSEVDTKCLINTILADGKSLFLPKCEVATHTMQAIKVEDLSTLKKGAYGIEEPVGDCINPAIVDLVIVPLVSFDRSCARLGYGGGYYDRFLPKITAKRIAIAFSEQETDRLPTEDTDVLMDMIITEKETIYNAF